MIPKYKLTKSGFSLLELLLALGILGLITVFAVSISHSTRNLAKTNDTKNRMKEIKRAAVDYYSGHRDLPDSVGSNEVPVGTSGLNLEQKHRLDAWGRYFYYDWAVHAVVPSRTDITGIAVNGKSVAAVIISGGPNQMIESSNASSPYATAGDDILLSISLAEQALSIAMNDLQVLQSKVQALDKMFAGVDNDSDDEFDENGCVQAIGCPQGVMLNDPNCSVATLDAINPPAAYSFCSENVNSQAELIVGFYELGTSILLDPWLNNYEWGKPPSCDVADLCYHKFFSFGPDGSIGGNDDIVP